MESFLVAWRSLLFASIFAFPLLLGILLYFRLSRAPRWLAVIVGTLAPAIFFFWLAPIFFFAGLREAYAHGETCGMPAFAAMLLLLTGTIIELGLGIVTQAALSVKRRRKKHQP
jgi:hypothetical protein